MEVLYRHLLSCPQTNFHGKKYFKVSTECSVLGIVRVSVTATKTHLATLSILTSKFNHLKVSIMEGGDRDVPCADSLPEWPK